jgi:hypothetical protein
MRQATQEEIQVDGISPVVFVQCSATHKFVNEKLSSLVSAPIGPAQGARTTRKESISKVLDRRIPNCASADQRLDNLTHT